MLLLLYVRLGIYNCWYAQTREQMLHSKNDHTRVASYSITLGCLILGGGRIIEGGCISKTYLIIGGLRNNWGGGCHFSEEAGLRQNLYITSCT